MKIGILFNHKRVDEETPKKIACQIENMGSQAVLFAQADEICTVDRLLVLGGDGTILHCAQVACRNNIPIVGVNFGTRGFLAEFEREEIEEAIDFILSDDVVQIQRSMLEVTYNGMRWTCLNEIALLRNSVNADDQVVNISLKINGSAAGEFIADGLIVATPTGSTAYSLSAGGCILTPDCETFLLTPVCAFSLRSRPIVCSDGSVLSLTVESGNMPLVLHGDGVYLGKAETGDSLTVCKSKLFTTFLTKDKSEFFRRLTKKIN